MFATWLYTVSPEMRNNLPGLQDPKKTLWFNGVILLFFLTKELYYWHLTELCT